MEFPTRAEEGNESLIPIENPDEYFEEGVSKILISQRTTLLGLNFNEESSNCYVYVYKPNPAANWNDGFNFTSVNPLGWEKIIANGTFNNGYDFGALFFPKGYNSINKVSSDQSKEDDFVAADVMGTYHFAERQERLRFRLFHLMCRLRVNLYIPAWDEEKNNGFNKGAIKEATTLNFRTDFEYQWSGINMEQAPKTTPPTTEEGEIADIKMYLKDSKEEPYPENFSNFKIDLEEDIVREYTYEVYFPEQVITNNNNILKFVITRGNMEYNYYFKSDYITNGRLMFEQGEITNLDLYLPRTDNEVVLLKANKLKWEDANSSFTITEE